MSLLKDTLLAPTHYTRAVFKNCNLERFRYFQKTLLVLDKNRFLVPNPIHDDKQMILQVQGFFKDMNAQCSVVKI